MPPPSTTPFKRHLSFFDRSATGTITPLDSLRAALSVGLNFPCALLTAFGLHILYGTSGPLSLTRIDVQHVRAERTMLEGFVLRRDHYSRGDLMKAARGMGWVDWFHVMGLWSLAADRQGRVARRDIALFQRGELLTDLERRRRDRGDVLPFLRGGPISVAGHSWLVGKLFDVQVYQDKSRRE